MTCARTADVVVTSGTEPVAASDFANSDISLDAAGILFFHRPARLVNGSVADETPFGKLLPDGDESQVCQLVLCVLRHVVGTRTLTKVHETGGKVAATVQRVQSHHLDPLSVALGANWQTSTRKKRSLEQLGCPAGVAKDTSVPDGWGWRQLEPAADEEYVVGCLLEAKNSASSPVPALRQAFAESTNVALRQRQLGVACADVCVPLFATTGQLVQFGVTRMLEPAFPYLVVVSKVLDLQDAADLQEAARLLAAMKTLCDTTLRRDPAWRYDSDQLAISTTAYYRKPLSVVFPVYKDLDRSLTHMMRVVSKLRDNPGAAQYVVGPITMYKAAAGNAEFPEEYLVFEHLGPLSFTIGLPTSPCLVDAYLAEVRTAMTAIHAADVVHLDFYPSNFMWRKVDQTTVEVKIIDWDSAHDVRMGDFTPLTLDRMQNLAHRRDLVAEADGDPKAWDRTLLEVLEWASTQEQWRRNLQTSNKRELDKQFKACIFAYIDEHPRDGGGDGDGSGGRGGGGGEGGALAVAVGGDQMC
jgi:hypothetical protein